MLQPYIRQLYITVCHYVILLYDVGKKYVEYPTTCTTSKDHLTLRLQGKMFDQNMNTNSGCATAQAARRRHPTARNIFGY